MKNAKEFVIFTLVLIVSVLFISVIPTDAEAAIYEDTLRLHILANSDSEEDQELKLRLRDKILEKYGVALSGCQSLEEAKERSEKLIHNIEEDSEDWLHEMGAEYDVSATIGIEWYDTREYDTFTLPAGYYLSLRVIIGEGEGRNWWCVMYPPMCLDIATESAKSDDAVIDYTKEETKLIEGGGYKVKFKLLEMFSRVISKKG